MSANGRMINVGLVGYGYWGPNLLRNLIASPGCNVTAVCDSSRERLALAKERFPTLSTFTEYDELLALDSLDAVVIATPIFTHYSLAKKALAAGKHTFVEKPIATSGREALDLLDSAERQRLTLMVGHTFLYSPPVNKVKELIDSGELGEICYVASSRVNLGIHQPDVSVIWDLAPHDFSIIFFWLGEEPSKVSASGRAFVQKGLHDVAFIDLDFPSGVVAHVQDSWLSPSKRRQMTVVGSRKMVIYDDTNLEEQVRIFDKGVAYIDDPDCFGKHQLTYRTGDITTPRLEPLEPLAVELGHFVDCVRTGARPKTDGFHGLGVVRALEAAQQSISNGGGKKVVQPLGLDNVLADTIALTEDLSHV